jgi:uncharacterized protein
MNKKINIGTYIDIQKLLDTRLLIQAGSGGGKSYALRKVIESIGNTVQQIVLDPEGEFVTLREKFDFVLVGKEGDIPLSLKYAETLAHKLLETNLSAIIDLYELKHHERILFVKRFLDALVNAPKELWHSCFVYVDEAHIFCPESSKAESMSAVIDMCTRGRKRGFSAVLATQRLSKLHKDAAAECLNKMIGRTGLDIDRKRAGDELGLYTKDSLISLRELQPGEFYGFGPALSNEVKKFKVSPVITTHLQSGKRIITAPPTPKAVKQIISKLSSIPEEAEKELNTKQELLREVTRLRTELTKANKSRSNELTGQSTNQNNQQLREEIVSLKQSIQAKGKEINQWRTLSESMKKLFLSIKSTADKALSGSFPLPAANIEKPVTFSGVKEALNLRPKNIPFRKQIFTSGNDSLGKCSREIIRFLAQYQDREFSKAQVAIATGYSSGSGGFNNALSELNQKGFILRSGKLQVNPNALSEIINTIGEIEPRTYDIETYKENLGKCEREIYEVLLQQSNRSFSKQELSQETETSYSPDSGGFNNALSRLNTLELIVRQSGQIKLNPELLDFI